MAVFVTYPAPYDTALACAHGIFEADTPAPPTPTWDDITVEWPHGCTLEAEVCWGVAFSRDPATVAAVAGAPACESNWEAEQFALPASYGVGGFGHTADWGPEYPWQGYGVTKYELLVDGAIAATLNGAVSYPDGPTGGPVWTPPDNCVTLAAGAVDWSSVRELSVRVYFNDVPRFVVFCYKQEAVDCTHTHVGDVTCNADLTESLCQEDFIEPIRSRKHDFSAGAPVNQPTACGDFGGGVGCHTCTCCTPLGGVHQCGIRLWSNTARLDFEKIDLTFESPETEFQCPIPFCEDFEDCGSAPEERHGTADCDSTGFYCSPTHVLEADLSDSNYWEHEAISGISPVYLAGVLWLPTSWTLPPSSSNDVLVLAAQGDPDEANPYFEGAAIRIVADGSGNPTVYCIGAYGNLGSTFNVFGTPTELCLGEGNCLQVRYWAGDNTLPPSLGTYPVGTVVANGVEVGREVRPRNDTDTPHAEAVIFGAIAYAGDLSALVDQLWLDDVCYGQAGWIDCACSCNPPTGDVYLTRAIAPETADPAWTPPSASGVVNLRGVTTDSSGDGSASAGGGDPGTQLGGTRIKLG